MRQQACLQDPLPQTVKQVHTAFGLLLDLSEDCKAHDLPCNGHSSQQQDFIEGVACKLLKLREWPKPSAQMCIKQHVWQCVSSQPLGCNIDHFIKISMEALINSKGWISCNGLQFYILHSGSTLPALCPRKLDTPYLCGCSCLSRMSIFSHATH